MTPLPNGFELIAEARTKSWIVVPHDRCEPRGGDAAPLVTDPVAQVQHPVALDHRVRVLEQILGIDGPEVWLA